MQRQQHRPPHPRPQPLNIIYPHFILLNSSCHFLFHYPNITLYTRLYNPYITPIFSSPASDTSEVKEQIRTTAGFKQVNNHVKAAMVTWIGDAVKEQFHALIKQETIGDMPEV